jgi:hypothetical protein
MHPRGGVGRGRLEDLVEGAQALDAELVREGRQEGRGPVLVSEHVEVRLDEGADQPSPDRALMIGGVAAQLIAPIVWEGSQAPRGEAAQAGRGVTSSAWQASTTCWPDPR